MKVARVCLVSLFSPTLSMNKPLAAMFIPTTHGQKNPNGYCSAKATYYDKGND